MNETPPLPRSLGPARRTDADPATAPVATPDHPVPETRERLLRAGLAAFASRGFAAASVREITTAADANLGAITYHFGSKQGLYDAVLESVFGRLRERVARAESETRGLPAPDRLERLVRSVFSVLRETPELPYLIVQQVAATHALPGPALLTFPLVLRALIGVIAEGQAEGTIRDGEPLLMAISVVSQPAYFAVIARFLLTHVAAPLGPAPGWDDIEEHAVTFLRRGLAAEPDGETQP